MTAFHTTNRVRHYVRRDGRRILTWAKGVGDLWLPDGSPDHGEVLAAQPWSPNDLANEGQEDILDVYFRAATAPTNLFFRLFNDTPVRTDGLSDLTGEVSGTGYSAISLDRNGTDWPTLSLDAPGTQVKSGTETFSAGGTWTDATYLVVASTSDNSGLLIGYDALSTTRQLEDGDSLEVDFALTVT